MAMTARFYIDLRARKDATDRAESGMGCTARPGCVPARMNARISAGTRSAEKQHRNPRVQSDFSAEKGRRRRVRLLPARRTRCYALLTDAACMSWSDAAR